MSRLYHSKVMIILCSLLLVISCLVSAQDCSATKLCATGCCSEFGFCGTSSSHCGTGCLSTCNFKLDCDASNPCGTGKGCCSKFGFCGLGPDYCAPEVCVAGCDRKSQCNPGYGKSGFAEVEKCPLNVCCSKWGFCGLTKEFCGTRTVSRPSCGDGSTGSLDRVIGYYEGWAVDRSCQVYLPERIPTGIYTHINFAFAGIDPTTFQVVPASNSDIAMYARVVGLKEKDPDLKVNIAIGGWAFNDPGATATTFSDLVSSAANKAKFFASLTSFMATYGFDGVDLDWEYPGADDRSGRPTDFANFPIFAAELKKVLRSTGGRGELSIAIPASYWYLQHFDIKTLSKHVDYFNLMTYDLHGIWDKGPKLWQGAYLNAHTNLTEIKDSLDLLWRNGISSSQVSMGLGFYSRTFTMVDKSCSKPGCKFLSEGNAGPCSKAIGVLTNAEIEVIIKEKGLTPKLDEAAAVKIITWDDQWVAYDDAETFKIKSQYARSLCLGGVMVWAISHDSELSTSSLGLGTAAKRRFVALYSDSVSSTGSPTKDIKFQKSQCKWTNCAETCGNGWTAMVRQDTYANKRGELMMDGTNCDNQGVRTLCCPADMVQPDCHWVFHNNGNCDGDCSVLSGGRHGGNYVEVGTLSTGCHKGKNQAACCRAENVDSMALYDQCDWLGSAGNCDQNTCPAASPKLVGSTAGSGGVSCTKINPGGGSPADPDGTVLGLRFRPFCCAQSTNKEFANCEWLTSVGPKPNNKKDNYCRSGCPSGKVRIAMDQSPGPDGTNCLKTGGARVHCCDPNFVGTRTVRNPELDEFKSALQKFLIDSNGICAAPIIFGRRSLEEELIFGNLTEQGLQVRGDGIDNRQSTVLKYFKMMMAAIQNHETPGAFLFAVIEIWDDTIISLPNFQDSTYSNLETYFNNDADAKRELLANGYIEEANQAECKLSFINARINEKPNLQCGGNVCEFDFDFCNDSENEDLPSSGARGTDVGLVKREVKGFLTNGHHHSLLHRARLISSEIQPRAGGQQKSVNIFSMANPFYHRTITWNQHTHTSAGGFLSDDIKYDEAINYLNPLDCSNPAVIHWVFPPRHNPFYYNTEHLIEGQTIPRFLTSISRHELADGTLITTLPQVELLDFFVNFYTSNVMIGQDDMDGGENPLKPADRVAEAIGSTYNHLQFVLTRDEINAAKGKLFSHINPVSIVKMTAAIANENAPFHPILYIRAVIAVFNYMNHASAQVKHVKINNDLRAELDLAQTVYNNLATTTPADRIDLVGLWDVWIRSELLLVTREALAWCTSTLTAVALHWQGRTDAIAVQVLAHVVALRGHLNEIVIDINGFD